MSWAPLGYRPISVIPLQPVSLSTSPLSRSRSKIVRVYRINIHRLYVQFPLVNIIAAMAEQSNTGARRIRRSDIESMRCPHCAGPLSKEMETSEWTVPPLIRDSFSMIGSAVGGTAGAFYGFNHAMPIVQRWIKGPMWLHFLIGAPPVIVFSSGCAGLAGGAIPALAQLASSSYHAAMSSSSSPPSSS